MSGARVTAYLLKSLMIVLVSLAVLVGGLWLLSPAIARHVVKQPLKTFGVSAVESTAITYNPFKALLTVRDFSFAGATTKAFSIKSVVFKIHWQNPFLGRYRIEQALINGLSVSFEKRGERFFIADIEAFDLYRQFVDKVSTLDDVKSEVEIPEIIVSDSKVEYKTVSEVNVFDLISLRVSEGSVSSSAQYLKLNAKGHFQNATVFLDSEVSLQNGDGYLASELDVDDMDIVFLERYFQQPQLSLMSGLFSVSVKPMVTIRKGVFDVSFADLKLKLRRLNMKIGASEGAGS